MSKNNNIFRGKHIVWPLIIPKICNSYMEIPVDEQVAKIRTITLEVIDKAYPWAHFDISAQEQGCGNGIILHISETHYFYICMGLGEDGTNNFAELLTLHHLLYFAIKKNCRYLQVYGDSKIVINWFNCISTCHAYTLGTILDDVWFLK